MQLNYEQIRSIAWGAVRDTVEPDGITFHRFTLQQHQIYEKKNEAFFQKSKTSAGVRLCFKTDSRSLCLNTTVENARSRTYFSFDVFSDDTFVGSLDNYSDQEIPDDYSNIDFPCGMFEKTFDLGEGVKTVTVHLPWNKITKIHRIALDDGAFVEPVKRSKKLLAFGDSITQGFDALRPSGRYIAQLADALDAEEFNKAIGGERYCPDLAALRDDFTPDYIVVAYGTNDWSGTTKEVFYPNSKAFFKELEKNYPGIRTFVITPIWRVNYAKENPRYDSFFEIESGVREAAAHMKNVTVISGFDLVPHSVDYFGDYGLHPNLDGFSHYFNNLWKIIAPTL